VQLIEYGPTTAVPADQPYGAVPKSNLAEANAGVAGSNLYGTLPLPAAQVQSDMHNLYILPDAEFF
jgi:hypothetical protein